MNQQNEGQTSALKRPAIHDQDAWKSYWVSQNQPWRTQPEIDADRQRYLTERLHTTANIEEGLYPFKEVKLGRADLEWLLEMHKNTYGPMDHIIGSPARGLDLRGADLRHADLSRLPLTQIRGGLQSSNWLRSTEEQREAAAIHLEGANLNRTDLRWATLRSAHLEGTDLRYAHLEGAHLLAAHLEGCNAVPAPANLRNASFSKDSILEDITLGNEKYGFTLLADINWGDANLALIDWKEVKSLGDEEEALQKKSKEGQEKSKIKQLGDFKIAIRANRQLVTVLQAQGLNEEAVYFAYRAHMLRRKALRLQGIRFIGPLFFSLFLDVLAGYGYKPERTLLWYIVVILGFSWAYYSLESIAKLHLTLVGALIFSITAFHGRGFFPGGFGYNDPVTILSAIEAIIGLLVELSFIATFTQRFFGK